MTQPYECSFEPKNGAETRISDDGIEFVIFPSPHSSVDLVIKIPKGLDYKKKLKKLPVKIRAIRLFLKTNGTEVGNKQYEQDDVLKLKSFEDGETLRWYRYDISKSNRLKYVISSEKDKSIKHTAIIFDLKFPDDQRQLVDLFLRPSHIGRRAKRIPSFQVVLNDPKLQRYYQNMTVKSYDPKNLRDTGNIIRNSIPIERDVPTKGNDDEEEDSHNSMDVEENKVNNS